MTALIGTLLALACALTNNVGFLFKHRGACAAPEVDFRHPFATARSLFGSRLFSIGMAIAAAAWLLHVAAMAVAPLSLVQSVLAGGVVLLALMAQRSFGLAISPRQWTGIVLTAVGLLVLGVTLPSVHGAHSRFSPAAMTAFEASLLVLGALLIAGRHLGASARLQGFMLGAAAGIMFGVSDVAVKALSGIMGAHGITGLFSLWLPIAAAGSVTAFYASAKGLQDGDAVPVIAVTGTATNVSGIAGGILVFGDPLSPHPVAFTAELIAFALVLVAAWLTPGAAGVDTAPGGAPAALAA